MNQNAVLQQANNALASSNRKAIICTKNALTISPATLRALASASKKANKELIIYADTMSFDNKYVQARLYLEPVKLVNLKSDLKISIYTDKSKTAKSKAFFNKWFSNNLEVIKCSQQGSFGAGLQISAKLDLTNLNTKNLVFYSYDKASNTFSQIDNTGYFIDSNGYLHFFTEKAGDIIVTDSPLTKR